MKNILSIKNLHVEHEGREILKGINLEIQQGEVVAVMGPNGSGKSTLANVILGNPNYKVTQGKIFWNSRNILKLPTFERAKLGIFLSFQNPVEVSGVNLYDFLFTSYNALHGKNAKQEKFDVLLAQAKKDLKVSEDFLGRSLNEGFSGGEKKKCEMLQMRILQPTIAILDEVDSGLDIDALKMIAKNISLMAFQNTGVLVITHYQRLLTYLKPSKVYILFDGKIVKEGNGDLVKKLEKNGYSQFTARQEKSTTKKK